MSSPNRHACSDSPTSDPPVKTDSVGTRPPARTANEPLTAGVNVYHQLLVGGPNAEHEAAGWRGSSVAPTRLGVMERSPPGSITVASANASLGGGEIRDTSMRTRSCATTWMAYVMPALTRTFSAEPQNAQPRPDRPPRLVPLYAQRGEAGAAGGVDFERAVLRRRDRVPH